jgi:hypothetical protein
MAATVDPRALGAPTPLRSKVRVALDGARSPILGLGLIRAIDRRKAKLGGLIERGRALSASGLAPWLVSSCRAVRGGDGATMSSLWHGPNGTAETELSLSGDF